MRILCIDSHSVMVDIIETLRQEGHEVWWCMDLIEAEAFWVNSPGSVDCIIIDIAFLEGNLPEAEENGTEKNWVTGWIWLKKYILKEKPDFASRIIIFSTRQALDILEKEDSSARQRVRIVCKNGEINCVAALVVELEKISKLALK